MNLPPADLAAAARALAALMGPPAAITRSTFNALTARQQAEHCQRGGRITPDPKPSRRGSVPVAVTPMTRADFLRADAADRARTIR